MRGEHLRSKLEPQTPSPRPTLLPHLGPVVVLAESQVGASSPGASSPIWGGLAFDGAGTIPTSSPEQGLSMLQGL